MQQDSNFHRSWKELKPGSASAAPGSSLFHLTLFVSMLMTCCFLLVQQPGEFVNFLRLSSSVSSRSQSLRFQEQVPSPTTLSNLVFGIGAAAHVLDRRKDYIKSWWRPGETRGFIYLDKPIANWSDSSLPEIRVSEDTSRFNYTYRNGKRSAIRISRIVSEMFRLRLPNVRWFVLGDDDTVFFVDNLVKVLAKYDHREFFYVGSSSENHIQNVRGFSSNMAYGGGGFAISYPLAEALASMQDGCLERYHFLYGSDDRIQACMAELGVQLTREPGFHQLDILGDASGILAAHPVAPLLSLHHLNIIHPLFPGLTQEQSVKRLVSVARVDPGGVLQQSICYDRELGLSVQVSFGYMVQVTRGLVPPRMLELPLRTFAGWYGERSELSLPFKTRVLSADPCERPVRFYVEDVEERERGGGTVSNYTVRGGGGGGKECKERGLELRWIHVEKEMTRESWYRAPRRECCRIVNDSSTTKVGLRLHVGTCRKEEFTAIK